MTKLARFMALLGGVVLSALVVLTSISILGRGLNTFGHSDFLTGLSQGAADWLIGTGVSPLNGDFELVESGIAFAIFAFLPICQLYSAHATVDVFTNMLPRKTNKLLITFWEIVLSAVMILIALRLFEGMMNKIDNGETTFLLQYPVWWSFAASLVAAVVAAIVAIYCAVARVIELISGRPMMPDSGGAVH
ncbi:TRAP transporter small permease subunit [Mesobacterium sp. TK19101]|uniref:TRAP transporter small permease protein n=1 Tax=Mesobacterium hydrothermale TaxID=3111907 RepID=A0ABU6HHD6_9RHOB|nr:TRAP transporter small permease subunit [Mesobacterium sp. TK19101]MEC3860525.1 TRAP transporter small permease subunit [Mesobacterium sp. TK19101]